MSALPAHRSPLPPTTYQPWTVSTFLNLRSNYDASGALAALPIQGATGSGRGLIKAGPAGTVFTLPVGFRPTG